MKGFFTFEARSCIIAIVVKNQYKGDRGKSPVPTGPHSLFTRIGPSPIHQIDLKFWGSINHPIPPYILAVLHSFSLSLSIPLMCVQHKRTYISIQQIDPIDL